MSDADRLLPLVQPRSKVTRQALVHAALKLWTERGFEEVTVEDICNHAGVAKGTFYRYFERKEAVLIEFGMASSARATAAALPAGGTRDALHAQVDALASSIERSTRDLVERSVLEFYRTPDWRPQTDGQPDLRGAFIATLNEGRDVRGDVPPAVDVTDLAASLAAMTMQAILGWARGETAQPLKAILRRRVDLLLYGALGHPPS